MSLSKAELIKMLQEDKSPMDTPIQVCLACTNNDENVISLSVTHIGYSKDFGCLFIEGTYEEDEF